MIDSPGGSPVARHGHARLGGPGAAAGVDRTRRPPGWPSWIAWASPCTSPPTPPNTGRMTSRHWRTSAAASSAGRSTSGARRRRLPPRWTARRPWPPALPAAPRIGAKSADEQLGLLATDSLTGRSGASIPDRAGPFDLQRWQGQRAGQEVAWECSAAPVFPPRKWIANQYLVGGRPPDAARGSLRVTHLAARTGVGGARLALTGAADDAPDARARASSGLLPVQRPLERGQWCGRRHAARPGKLGSLRAGGARDCGALVRAAKSVIVRARWRELLAVEIAAHAEVTRLRPLLLRAQDLIVEELGDELLVFDAETNHGALPQSRSGAGLGVRCGGCSRPARSLQRTVVVLWQRGQSSSKHSAHIANSGGRLRGC